jgi:maleylpyruvate isomerase
MSSQVERPEQALEWVSDGTRRLLGALANLTDTELDEPTLLPGWNRRHLLAHIANNATALRNLFQWALTGEERPMYASSAQRAADIEAVAVAPAGELRELVAATAAALGDDLDGMPEEAWSAQIVTAQGVSRNAAEIPWMRVRELYVHAVDLDAGVAFADLPASFLAALLDDIANRRTIASNGPALSLAAADTDGWWAVGGTGEPVAIEAPLAVLAAWLSGRPVAALTDADGAPAPDLPAWL